MTTDAKPTTRRPPVALALRVAAAGLVVGGILLLVSGSRKERTVSQVIAEIHDIALARPQGGLIGPWWVSAAGVEGIDRRLTDFKVESQTIHIAARTARVIVNPQQDSFKFDMRDVVFTTIPGPDQEEASLQRLDHYVLGPLAYGKDIVPDKGLAVESGK